MKNQLLQLFVILLWPVSMVVFAQEAPPVPAPTATSAPTIAPATPVTASTQENRVNGGELLEDIKRVDQVLSATDQARLRHRVTLAKGLMQIREGKLAEAMKTLEASLEAWPDSVVALTQLAELCYRDDTPRAQGYLDRTARIDPDYYRLHFIQALVHQKNSKFDEMLASLDRCLEISPEQTRARQLRAEYLRQRTGSPEMLKRAIEDFMVLQQAMPQQSMLWSFYIGQCYYQLKEYGKAQKFLEPVLSTPLAKEAAYLLGLCKQGLGQYAEALEYIDKAKGGVAPDENVASLALMQAEASTGEMRIKYKSRALEELAMLLKKPNYKSRPDQYRKAGELALELGLPKAAVEYLEKYVEKVPNDADGKILLLQAHMIHGDPEATGKVRDLFTAYLQTQSATSTEVATVRREYLKYLVRLKQWPQVDEELQAIEKAGSNDGELAIIRAQVAYGKEDYAGAIQAASKALAFPENGRDEVEMLIGLSHLKAGSDKEAAKHFDLAIEAASETIKGLRCLEVGNLYQDSDKTKEKLAYWKRALSLHPTNQQLRYEIGLAYLRSGSPEESVPFLEQVAKEAEEATLRSQAYTLRGYSALVMGASSEAEKAYRSAIEAWPSNLMAVKGLAHLMADLERYEESRELFKQAVAQSPEDATTYIQLGIVCDKMNDIEGAENASEGAIRADPNYSEGYNFLGYMYAERGIKLDRALELIEKALSLEPNNPNITDSLGWVYFQKGDYQKSIETLEKAITFLSEDYMRGSSVIFEHLGDAYEKIGNIEKARELWKKAAEGDPKSQTAPDKVKRTETVPPAETPK